MIRLNRVSGGYEPHVDKIHEVSLHVEKGSFFTLIGPNGSGKSTLIHMISGVLPIRSGEVYLQGQLFNTYSAIQRASFLTVLSQEHDVAFDFSVHEIVLLGRYPHQRGWLKTVTDEDEKVVEEAMRTVKVLKYRDQPFRSLSGGEKQRVLLAKALAQEPDVLLLDEPTNHLDIRHMHEMLHLIKTWQQKRSLTVLAVLHDLNIASLYSDRIGLLNEGRLVNVGDAGILRNDKLLEQVYGIPTLSQEHPLLPKPQLFLSPPSVEEEAFTSSFSESFLFQQDEEAVQIVFDRPLRTLSNAMQAEGMKWHRYFCLLHGDETDANQNSHLNSRKRIEELHIPIEQAVCVMTTTPLQDWVWITRFDPDCSLAVLAAVSPSGAADIFLFIDQYLSDGSLVQAMLTATEAKVRALQRATVTVSEMISDDRLLVAATQRGPMTRHTGTGTALMKQIGQMVHQAVYDVFVKAVQSSN